MVGAVLAVHGVTVEGLRLVLRVTACTSALLFLMAFLASPLRRLRRDQMTGWLLRNRRYIGVSFATSHAYHLVALVSLFRLVGEVPDAGLIFVGGLGYAFIAAMTATSFDRTAAWLGPGRWRRLHVTGLYYLWIVFAVTFARSPERLSRVLLAALFAALLARLWLLRRRQAVRDGVVG